MLKLKSHTNLSRAAMVVLLLLTLFTTSCERKDLWLRPENGTIQIAIYDVRLDLIWGVEWKTQWQYNWDVNMYGDMGYTTPTYVRASIYDLDDEMKRVNAYTKNFPASGGKVSLRTGAWYDMLFYSAGTEYTIFNQDAGYNYYDATTRASDYTPVISRGSTEDENGQETEKTYTGYKQPDELFGTFLRELEVSSDPTIYDQIVDEETGEIVYLYNIEANMMPYSFIYLLQVMVINNTDSIGQIISLKRNSSDGGTVRYGASGLTMTGLAQGVELYSRKTYDQACSITMDEADIRTVQSNLLTLPNGEQQYGDIFATRMVTWGLPGIVPFDELEAQNSGSKTRASEHQYTDRNKLGVKFYLRNGYTHTQVFDVSEQMRAHPTGGVITVVMDAAENVSQEELEQKQPDSGGGFSADVENWQNEVNADVTI